MSDDYINKIISTNLDALIKKENVLGLAAGTKIKVGIDTGEKCIIVFVSKKVSENKLSPSNIIPYTLENVKTDVIVIETMETQDHPSSLSFSTLAIND